MCEPMHFLFILRLTCQNKPGRPVKVKTRRSISETGETKERLTFVRDFSCFVNVLTNADLRFSSFSKQFSLAFRLLAVLSISRGSSSTLQPC